MSENTIQRPADIVEDIVASRVPAHLVTPAYQQIVGLVKGALEQRDDAIADALRNIGSREGLNPMKVEGALVEIGLVQSEPEPEPEANGSDPGGTVVGITLDAWAEMLAEVDGIKTRVSRLESIAREALG